MVVHLEHTAVADGAVVGARRLWGDALLAHTHRLADQRALGDAERGAVRMFSCVFLKEVERETAHGSKRLGMMVFSFMKECKAHLWGSAWVSDSGHGEVEHHVDEQPVAQHDEEAGERWGLVPVVWQTNDVHHRHHRAGQGYHTEHQDLKHTRTHVHTHIGLSINEMPW